MNMIKYLLPPLVNILFNSYIFEGTKSNNFEFLLTLWKDYFTIFELTQISHLSNLFILAHSYSIILFIMLIHTYVNLPCHKEIESTISRRNILIINNIVNSI